MRTRAPTVRRLMSSPRRSVALLTVVALAAVALLAISSIVLASNQVTTVVNKQVQTTAAVSAVVISKQTADLVALVHSYATRPSLANGVARGARGEAAVAFNLASLAGSVPGISATFMTDLHGTSRSTFPPEPSVYGTNFAYREWFKGLVASGRPFVSNAIETKEASHALAVTVTDYIRGSDGRPVGILGVNYSLESIQSFAANVGRAQGITLKVTDRVGTSLTAGGARGLASLSGDPRVQAALAGHTGLRDYTPLLAGGRHGPEELSAYAPVPGTGWTVIASIGKSVAFAGLVRLRYTVLGITALLVLILLATIRIIARSDRRQRDSELRVRSRDRELARVLESTHEAFLSTNASGAITAWNAQAEKLYGWGASEVLGRSFSETVVTAARRDELTAELASYLAGEGSAVFGKRVEVTALHRDGHEIPVEVSSWKHEDGDGFSAFVHDITERVTIQADLERARDQALQASRLKSEFLANMSHEIRTPMNGVIGMSSLPLNTHIDETQRDYAETVCSSAEALLTVIDDILDCSKIEAGKLDVEKVTFDLRSVVEESAALLAARAQQDDLELTCRIDPALPGALEGDPGRLRQVLLNLLGNAVKFTSAGEVNVTARLADEAVGDALMVELSVRDTGIGMTPATLEHLFDAFTQADSSTSRRYGGTGLGLAISRQLVELMGGTLNVTSESGAGSTFTALIPFGLALTAANCPEVADLVGVHALIVDDNLTNQRVLQEMVVAWGCTVVVADGAIPAMVRLREAGAQGRPFDVLLLDLNMPDIDGYGLARMVCADPILAHTPMVMLTSSAQRGEAERTQRAGIVAYLTKPVRSARLRGALNMALGPAAAITPDVAPLIVADPGDGAAVLTNGAAALTNGAPGLSNGAAALTNGAPGLSNGAAALTNGARGLSNGAAALTNGAPGLSNGAAALTNGAPGFSNGARGEVSGARTPEPDPGSPRSAAGSVLVVEDNLTNQKVLIALLASLGYRADVAANGVDAVEAVRLHHYAVVLMDCQMPVMDGYEATEKLRAIEGADRHTCVIAVTATAMAADRERCLAAGMDDDLAKPLSVESLAAVLAHSAPDKSELNLATVPARRARDTHFGRTEVDETAGDALAAAEAPALDAQFIERLERLGADAGEDLVEQLTALFLADADMGVAAMRDALAGEDAATLVRCAHALRGASANVGANALAGLCATLEAGSASGNLAVGQAQLAAAETELGRVRSALRSRTARR
jgi:PAS domain S-box-containing protein